MNMSLPKRRLIACAAILVILVVWVIAAATLAEHLPKNALVQLLFYAVAGIGWAAPVIPVISWSENYSKGKNGGPAK